MKIDELVSTARDAASVHKVFGEPIEKDGITVIPAAKIAGGAGSGHGFDKQGKEGDGGGFGVGARPLGAYVIKGDRVRWVPAVDVNHIVTVWGAAVVTAALVQALFGRRRSAKERSGAET